MIMIQTAVQVYVLVTSSVSICIGSTMPLCTGANLGLGRLGSCLGR